MKRNKVSFQLEPYPKSFVYHTKIVPFKVFVQQTTYSPESKENLISEIRFPFFCTECDLEGNQSQELGFQRGAGSK